MLVPPRFFARHETGESFGTNRGGDRKLRNRPDFASHSLLALTVVGMIGLRKGDATPNAKIWSVAMIEQDLASGVLPATTMWPVNCCEILFFYHQSSHVTADQMILVSSHAAIQSEPCISEIDVTPE